MVVHTCNSCFREFDKKSTYLNHINNKKKPCIPLCIENSPKLTKINQNSTQIPQNSTQIPQNSTQIPQNSTQIPQNSTINIKNDNTDDTNNQIDNHTNNVLVDNDLICKYCFKEFSRSDALKRHESNFCKVKKFEEEKKQNIFDNLIEKDKKIDEFYKMFNEMNENLKEFKIMNDTLKKQNDELNKKNEELEKKINKVLSKNTGNITNNNNTTNTNTNNTTQINNIIVPWKINPFGKESFEKISRKDVLKIMSDTDNNGKFCFNKLINLIHYNNKVPENQNIYMNDYNRGLYMIHDGSKWNLRKDEEFIIFSVLEHVRDLYNEYNDEELEKKLESDPKFNKSFQATFKKYFDYVYDEVDDKELDEKELKKKNDFKALMNKEVKNGLYNNRNIPKKSAELLENLINNGLLLK